MCDNKNPNEPRKLNDEDLAEVTGGYEVAVWNTDKESALQAEYEANGDGMSIKDYLFSKGMSNLEMRARNKWISHGGASNVEARVSLNWGNYKTGFYTYP